MDLTPTTASHYLFGGYTSSCMKDAEEQHYKHLSYALWSLILHTKTWNLAHCLRITQKVQAFANEKDEFLQMLVCLKAIFPHLGAPPINIIDEVNAITIKPGDTLNKISFNMTRVKQRFEMSQQIYSPTLLIQHFFGLFLSTPDIHLKMLILPIHQQLQVNLIQNGADSPFKMNLNDVYNFLNTCNIKGTYKFNALPQLTLGHQPPLWTLPDHLICHQ